MGKKELSKAERKALKAREAELAAELQRREAKKAKKAGKKKKAKKGVDFDATEAAMIADAKAERERQRQIAADAAEHEVVKPKSAKRKAQEAGLKVLAEDGSEAAKIAAATAIAGANGATDDETDEQIKARVLAKRERRAFLEDADYRASIDRNDHEAVRAYNEELGALGGGKFLTSTAESEAQLKRMASDTPSVTPTIKPKTEKKVAAAIEALKAEVTELETERGREFVAGVVPGDGGEAIEEAAAERAIDEFAKPSEAPRTDFEVNGNQQYKIKRPSDGKVVGYTRVTTYISCLEERSMLERWKLRMLLEGVAVNDHPDENGRIDEPVVATMRDLIHRRDVAIAKARKADRKGKLHPGQLATITDAAFSEFKKAVDELAEQLLDVGGAHEAATKGTDIHALTELYDREGIVAVGDLLTEGKITPQDLADVEAYADAIARAGIKIIPEHIEQVIVNDELKVAGRLDRIVMAKLPGELRARRRVLDIKTGRVDYGTAKIAQQIEMYAGGTGYDLNTHERTDLKIDRTKGLLLHLPAGSGEATLHVVDLSLGRKGNKIAGEVRAFRNEGKRAIDLKVDVSRVEAVSE